MTATDFVNAMFRGSGISSDSNGAEFGLITSLACTDYTCFLYRCGSFRYFKGCRSISLAASLPLLDDSRSTGSVNKFLVDDKDGSSVLPWHLMPISWGPKLFFYNWFNDTTK